MRSGAAGCVSAASQGEEGSGGLELPLPCPGQRDHANGLLPVLRCAVLSIYHLSSIVKHPKVGSQATARRGDVTGVI